MATHTDCVYTCVDSDSRFARHSSHVNVCTQPLVPGEDPTHPSPFNMIIGTCITCLLAQVQVNSDAINKCKLSAEVLSECMRVLC